MRAFPKAYVGIREFRVFKKLNTPTKIQDFLNAIPINFERGGETCCSPLMTLRENKAHCMEGAMLAAAILWYHGERPLLLDLKTSAKDDDHVITLFKRDGRWGALSKTNHGVLRYRDAIYRDPREVAMSYFNEYFLDDGIKTMRSYSKPFNLSRYAGDWLISEKNLWDIPSDLDRSTHIKILSKTMQKNLRPADKIEIQAGKLVEWKKN